MQTGTSGNSRGVIKSMTGFGRGRDAIGDVEVVTEIRAVNHRFLEISVKLPRSYYCFEPEVKKIVGKNVSRGKFDISITRSGGKGSLIDIILDENLAVNYFNCLTRMKQKLGLSTEISISDMLTLKDLVVPVEIPEGIEKERPLVENSLVKALNSLDQMRTSEGAVLWKDIENRLDWISETTRQIEGFVGQVTVAARDKFEKRIKELVGGIELDADRLLLEAALMADRSDVTEELTRLHSHITQFRSFGESGSPLGRKLDFLLQEIQREVNTLGSKSGSTEIAAYVVGMKSELEKIREQTQNIE
jgi:uncharacterized protein (TIGR00255 family)